MQGGGCLSVGTTVAREKKSPDARTYVGFE